MGFSLLVFRGVTVSPNNGGLDWNPRVVIGILGDLTFFCILGDVFLEPWSHGMFHNFFICTAFSVFTDNGGHSHSICTSYESYKFLGISSL